MKPPGTYKITRRTRPMSSVMDPLGMGLPRSQKIVESLRDEIVRGREDAPLQLRVRQVFVTPREIYRIELEVPEMSYLRTTLLDRDALEDLLETPEVRELLFEPGEDGPMHICGLESFEKSVYGSREESEPAASRQFSVVAESIMKSSAGEVTE